METRKVTDFKREPNNLAPAFSCNKVITKNIQMCLRCDNMYVIVTTRKFPFYLAVLLEFLRNVVVEICGYAFSESEVAREYADECVWRASF